MKRFLKLFPLLLLLAIPARAQISGAGQLSCNGAAATGTTINNALANNSPVINVTNTPAYAVEVQLDQTTTITGGVVTFQISYDGGANYVSVGAGQLLNPATGAQIGNPYTLVANTNQTFLVVLSGASTFQLKLTTAMTGTGAVTPWYVGLCTPPTIGPLTLDANGNLLAKVNTALPTGSNIIGKFGIDQTTPGTTNATQTTNLPTTVDTNTGNASASTLRVVLATNQPQLSNKLLVTPDADVETVPVATATTTNGLTRCYLTSAATNNSTNCKASAGNVYAILVTNTTTTTYYLRMYNLASAPTCSSSTGFVESIPALATAGNGYAGVIEAFTTGIGFCLTANGTNNDNTNAATGVYIEILYK